MFEMMPKVLVQRCSGRTASLEILELLRKKTAVGSFHKLNTFFFDKMHWYFKTAEKLNTLSERRVLFENIRSQK